MGDFAYYSGAFAAILVAGVGGLIRLNNAKFVDIGDKIERVLAKVDDISETNQRRHEENVQRLTRVETLVNGHNGARRKRI